MTDTPAPQAGFAMPSTPPPKKGFLRHAFNFVASVGVGAAVSISMKAAALAVFGTQLAALVPAAVGVGLASAALHRGRDMFRWNKAHANADEKVGVKDFFKASKTGHTGKDYLKRGALSGAFAVVGGLIGLGIDHWTHGASSVPTHTPAHPTPVPDTTPPPVAVAPVPVPDPVPVPVHVPTPEENLANLLNEAKSQIPAHHCAGIDSAVHRLSSVHENVQAQAIKDLGYYYANGFCGVHENDALADRLFQASLDVSHGHNIQALHDLGYQTLHGFGTAQDNGKAYELLTKAAAGGHPLSPPIIDYMKLHHLAPAAR